MSVRQFLLLSLIPSRNVLQIAGDTRDLRYVMAPANGTNRISADVAVREPVNNIVSAVIMVIWAHPNQIIFAFALRALAFVETAICNNDIALRTFPSLHTEMGSLSLGM